MPTLPDAIATNNGATSTVEPAITPSATPFAGPEVRKIERAPEADPMRAYIELMEVVEALGGQRSPRPPPRPDAIYRM